MLIQLYIKNFTLIDTLDIKLYPGFSVITGETGAGKSIILGAIGLLLGQRADSKSIKAGADKCVIEARFDLSAYKMEQFFRDNDIEYDASECIIRRELTSAGKSRSFVNDTPVPLSILKELGEQLVDIHSQHQNLLLNKQDFQLSVVDILADATPQLNTYQAAYERYHSRQHALEELRTDMERSRQETDFLQFQYQELESARLQPGEQEKLESRSETMSHAEEIKSALYTADNILSDENGIVSMLHTAVNELQTIVKVMSATGELAERMETCYVELKDIAHDISTLQENVDFDPAEMDRINERLDRLYELQKKYRVESISELIAIREKLHQRLSDMENSDETLKAMEAEVEVLHAACCKEADKLTQLRQKASRRIEREMQERLVPLGMPNVRFTIDITREKLGRQGQDKVSFLFSANTSTPLQPVSQVASGGEIARVMLSLKAMISGAVKLPTIIFDEIDTGVSGKTAEKMAHIMQEMGLGGRQVISITHLPQIASLGSHHYRVEKEEIAAGTVSRMRELNNEERISEIAQMLSGSDISAAAIENAKELLKI